MKRGGWLKRKTPLRNWDSHRSDPNDVLYSQIIRFGQTRCWRCHNVRRLEAAHIMGRIHKATRFLLEPVRNAIPLDGYCHRKWFDRHKQISLITHPERRVFTAEDESFTFLVEKCGYTWAQLEYLYAKHRNVCKYSPLMKAAIRQELEGVLAGLKKGVG